MASALTRTSFAYLETLGFGQKAPGMFGSFHTCHVLIGIGLAPG